MPVKASEDALLWGAKAPVVAPDANAPRRPHTGGGWEGVFFKLSEFSHSDTAVSLGIDNTIPEECKENIRHLVHCVLDPLRELWGLPIRVTSGYRCPELNEEVNGVEDSYHMDGCAADISAINPERNVELMSLIRAMHLFGCLPLTECYLGPKAKYIHIALDRKHIDPYPFI